MANLIASLFGPLGKDSCMYFYVLSMIFFIVLIITFITEVVYIVQHLKTVNFRIIGSNVLILFNIFIAYFVNRLLYNMCVKSLI
jgi:hypothetical protein